MFRTRPRGGLLAATFLLATTVLGQIRPPNLVVIFVDDMGYADIGPFGGAIPTPHLDRMAAQGMRFTDFSVATAVCSASRAALLTGCYHRRVGIAGRAWATRQASACTNDEMTLAEALQAEGLRNRVLRQMAPRPPS